MPSPPRRSERVVPVWFDEGAADRLSDACFRAANELLGQGFSRRDAASSALEQFEGPYASLFREACIAEFEDRSRLATALEELRTQVAAAKRAAVTEKQRQADLAAWEERDRERRRSAGLLVDAGENVAAWFDRMPSTTPVVPVPIAVWCPIRLRDRTVRRDVAQRCSANPQHLRGFASHSRAGNQALAAVLEPLRVAWSGFVAECSWEPVEVMVCVSVFTQYLAENAADAVWLDRLADCFEHAGGGTVTAKVLNLVGTRTLPGDLSRKTPAKVRVWWESLTPEEREELTSSQSLLIGNLNGIPFADRIAANQVTAASYLQGSDFLPGEREYWQQVVDGTVKLVVLDRAASRIVQMFGEIGPDTTQVITYIPGTTVGMSRFYTKEGTRVPEYLAGRLTGSVVFAYKDFKTIAWKDTPDGAGLAARGQRLADFQAGAVALDPYLAKLPQAAVGYSAGLWVVGGAELRGARYGQVISLGGSYVPDGWKPEPATRYADVRYAGDELNNLDGFDGLNAIHRQPDVFSPNVLESPNPHETKFEQHGRLGKGPEENEPVLKQIASLLDATS